MSGFITTGKPNDAKALTEEYENLAKQAGERLASLNEGACERNPHLQFLADIIRNSNERAPMTLVTEGLIL